MKQGTPQGYRHAPDTAWRRVEADAVVIDLRSGVYYSLNETAARVWELVGEGRAVPEIAELLSREFAEDAGSIEADARELVRQFLREKLIVPAP